MATQVQALRRTETARTREEWRRIMFDAIKAIAPVLEADALKGDALRQLPPATVAALKSSELLKIKYPAVLGGAEADNGLQFEVYERVAYHNIAASWCLFIYTDIIGRAAALLPEAGLATVY